MAVATVSIAAHLNTVIPALAGRPACSYRRAEEAAIDRVLTLLRQTAAWLLIVSLGTVAFLAAMFTLLAEMPGLAAKATSAGVAFAAGILAWWLFRRVHLTARQKGPIAAALRNLPRSAVVRSGRVRVLPSTFWIAATLFLGGAFLAALGAGYGGSTQALVLVTCTSAIAGGLIGVGRRRGVLKDVLTALSLPGALLLFLGLDGVTRGIAREEVPDVVGAIGLVAAVTAIPLLLGFGLGRLIRSRLDEGLGSRAGPHDWSRMSRGLATATERDRADAIVWTYPGSAEGDERRAFDRVLLASAGYDILVEERSTPQGSTAARVVGLLLSLDASSDDAWVRVLYRRRPEAAPAG